MNFTDLKNGKMLVSGDCAITGEKIEFEINIKEFEIWQQGVALQFAMPNLAPEKRDFILTGIGPNGFKELFSDEAPLMAEEMAEA